MSLSECWMTTVAAASDGGEQLQRTTMGVRWAGRLAWGRGERGREECFASLAFWHVCRGEDNVAWNSILGNTPSPTGTEVFFLGDQRSTTFCGISQFQLLRLKSSALPAVGLECSTADTTLACWARRTLSGGCHAQPITGDYFDCPNRQIGQTASATYARPGGSRLRWHVSADCRGSSSLRIPARNAVTTKTQLSFIRRYTARHAQFIQSLQRQSIISLKP